MKWASWRGRLGLRCAQTQEGTATPDRARREQELELKGLTLGWEASAPSSSLPAPASFSISQIQCSRPARRSVPLAPARDPSQANLRLTHHCPQPTVAASGPGPAARPSSPSCAGASPGARKDASRDLSRGSLGNGVRSRSRLGEVKSANCCTCYCGAAPLADQ